MSKFLLNLLLQISKALVNSKIQFLFQKFLFFLIFGPTSSFIFQPSRGTTRPLVHFGSRLPLADRWAHPVSEPGVLVRFGSLSVSTVAYSACLIRPLVRFGRRLLHLSDSAVASLSLTGGPTLSVSPGSSPSSDNA
jgi:hypothetical protein